VRGTVRSSSKSAFLNDRLTHYEDRFELVFAEDITKDVRLTKLSRMSTPFPTPHFHSTTRLQTLMVCPIFSILIPYFLAIKTYTTDLTISAVRGTTWILNSELKHGSALKRLVLTSSSRWFAKTPPCRAFSMNAAGIKLHWRR
jgi:hypothetical protein